MGKRSNFPRRAQDAYDTPLDAVRPLIPHLPFDPNGVPYWEPCAGEGALVDALYGLWPTGYCVLASDIAPRSREVVRRDALDCFPGGANLCITNPPWTREILHPMIEHFSDMRPTWLLFDADWIHTRQSALFMPRLRKIVSVGRVKWIPDSPHTGKDNCAWYLFDRPDAQNVPQFFGRTAKGAALAAVEVRG